MSLSVIAADVYGLTPGRAWSLVGMVLGVAGVVLSVRRLSVAAMACGAVGAVIGGLVVLMARGGPGTGYGIVGGYFALVVGVLAVVLGVIRRGARAAAPPAS
ncbi:DUF6223 family protein [Lentzea sp. NPDC004782]|uniref:DUF6223 family protein n=1 Tax=Lentzea sp. NPDC004782 TaxID=3154458 RepID=UPI0033B19AB7